MTDFAMLSTETLIRERDRKAARLKATEDALPEWRETVMAIDREIEKRASRDALVAARVREAR